MLLAMGLIMLVWRPCRGQEGRAPRSAVVLLLLSGAAVWTGSFGLLVVVLAGHVDTARAACGLVWHRLVIGHLEPWQFGLLAVWVVMLPGRGIWDVARRVGRSYRLLNRLRPLAGPIADPGRRVLLVHGLDTVAITLGVVRPVVFLDARLWRSFTGTERAVVVAHERAHQRGRHGLVDAAAGVLAAGLAPLPAAADALACVRRHLEALADDAAVRRYGVATVGVVLGRVALGARPSAGLGAAGNALWRVKRLIDPDPVPSWRARVLLGAGAALMGVVLLAAGGDVVQVLSWLATPHACHLRSF